MRYEWVDPLGVVRDLTHQTSPTLFVSRGATSLGTAGAEITDEKLPTAAGSIVRRISTPAQQIELPITIQADSLGALLTTIDNMRGWFDTGDETRRTPGYLRVTRPDGTVRQLGCYYAGGLEGDLTTGGPNGTTYVISLYAPDPWPTAAEEIVTTWTAADVFAGPVSIINPGQLDAYPIWKITGPTVNISISNDTTGKPLSLVRTLTGGQYVTIDSRPPSQRVTLPILDNLNVSQFPNLFPGSLVFENWMPPGLNEFSVILFATSGATSVELRYLPRYRGMVR